MPKYLVSVFKWENSRVCEANEEYEQGDLVVIKDELYNEIGTIVAKGDNDGQATCQVVRRVTDKDLAIANRNKEKKQEIFSTTRGEIKRLELPMKLIDVALSLDGAVVTVIFTADERVDFRALVRNLSKIFRRSVRMQQIGSRDEARQVGGCGVCGKELCCLRFSGSLPSISIEMARVQQIAHRGSERISGICGRLMCCLGYEACQYKEMLEGMPEAHSKIKTTQGNGEVVEVNALTGDIKIRTEDGKYLTIKKEDIK